jgi:ABC-type glutathione transport system ATPase component
MAESHQQNYFPQYRLPNMVQNILARLVLQSSRRCGESFASRLTTIVTGHGNQFTLSQILRLLLARAIANRPHVRIVDGTLHSMVPSVREVMLGRLCSKNEPWSIIFVSNDPTFTSHVDRRITLY